MPWPAILERKFDHKHLEPRRTNLWVLEIDVSNAIVSRTKKSDLKEVLILCSRDLFSLPAILPKQSGNGRQESSRNRYSRQEREEHKTGLNEKLPEFKGRIDPSL